MCTLQERKCTSTTAARNETSGRPVLHRGAARYRVRRRAGTPATPLLLDDSRRRGTGLYRGRGAARGSSVVAPCTTRKAPHCRAFRCAEEDSNLHPVSLDQALNLVTRVSDPSVSRQIVRIVQARGRYGHIGRFGCCRRCCHDSQPRDPKSLGGERQPAAEGACGLWSRLRFRETTARDRAPSC